MTDDTTSKNFTAGEGLEFKWYINKGTLTVTVGEVENKTYDGEAVEAPDVTVVNQKGAAVADVTTIQYQKLDEETGEYGEVFDDAPVDAGTYRAVVTAVSENYNEKVEYSNEFTIAKRTVEVNLNEVPEIKGYKDTVVGYTLNAAEPEGNTGIVNEEVALTGTVTIKAGKEDGDTITNDDLAEITEALGDNYTFTFEQPLALRDAKLADVKTTTAYILPGETVDPNEFFTAFDEVEDDITDRCKVSNIDIIRQTGEYEIKVVDTTEEPSATFVTRTLFVKYQFEEVEDLLNTLPPLDEVTPENEQAIVDAREALENLSEEQAAKVDEETIQKLEDYEVALEGAKKAAADKAAAEAVDDLIDEIGEVAFDDESKAKIDAAAEAYDALTDDQKALVENKEVLDNAQADYANLKAEADKAAADEVAKLINALPAPEAVTKDDGDAIAAAQEAYDALTDEQKALVDPEVAKKLTDAAEAFDKVNFAIGDVNGDGEINVTDILRIAAHIKHKIVLTDEQLKRADVNGDGNINVTDITKIAAHIKGKKLLK
ncbi:MAG: dockerin type I repeat-containing protein [Ruminococcus sp.]|nr:dockerin type I repeat-containing protein [Ruminococcus sp.]